MKIIEMDNIEQLERVIRKVVEEFKKGEEKVHILGDIISYYITNPLNKRELDNEELYEDIKFDLKSALEHDGLL